MKDACRNESHLRELSDRRFPRLLLTYTLFAVIYNSWAGALVESHQPHYYHRRSVFTDFCSHTLIRCRSDFAMPRSTYFPLVRSVSALIICLCYYYLLLHGCVLLPIMVDLMSLHFDTYYTP